MNKIYVVGLGPGNLDYLSGAGVRAIEKAEIVVGGKRQLEEIEILLSQNCKKYILGKLLELVDYIKNNREKKITVVVSGDTGFYSLLPFIKKYFSNEELEVIPGISSYQYMFSKLGECWQNFVLASAHGRDFDYVEAMIKNEGVVLLTDEKNTPYIIGKKIYDSGIRGVEIIVGERLSYPDETITKVDVEKFEKLNREFKMNIVVLKKGENYAHL